MNKNVNKAPIKDNDSVDVHVFLGDLWRGFVKFWWIAVLISTVFVAYQFYNSYVKYVPRYTCTATYTVQNENSKVTGDDGLSAYTYTYNQNTSDQLSKVFPYIVNNSVVRQKVLADLGLSSLPATISAVCVPDSNMVTLSTEGLDPKLTYDVLVSVSKNYSVVAEYVLGHTRLVTISEPRIPTSPSNSRDWIMSVVKGILAGCIIGFLWITVYAIIRRTIRTKEDIKTKLNKRCLGVLPQVTFKKYRQQINTDILINNPRIGDDFLESMRLLRSSVKTALGENGKILMITSTAPGEGKSVTTLNLAAMFAKNESKTLVVDCDMRNSGINEMLKLESAYDDGEKYKIRHIEELGIDLLSFNTKGKRIRKILQSPFLGALLNEMREEYDYIIIDTPPCGVISDAASIAAVSDGVLYIIRQDNIIIGSIRASIANILSSEARLLGCVLNGVMGGYGGYGYYYNYRGYNKYYRYGYSKYGYGYGKKRKRSERKRSKKTNS